MAHAEGEHRRLVLDQFTRPALPFSQMRDHAPGLILAAAEVRPDDTVLDVACGPREEKGSGAIVFGTLFASFCPC